MAQLNKILVVNDDSVTQFLIQRTLTKSQISKEILMAGDGSLAFENRFAYLFGESLRCRISQAISNSRLFE